jgi:hypothetical protein
MNDAADIQSEPVAIPLNGSAPITFKQLVVRAETGEYARISWHDVAEQCVSLYKTYQPVGVFA